MLLIRLIGALLCLALTLFSAEMYMASTSSQSFVWLIPAGIGALCTVSLLGRTN